MNQEINNEFNPQENINLENSNNIPEQQVQAPIETNAEAPQTQEVKIRKPKRIVLEEDPVKFEVKPIETVTETPVQELTQIEEPKQPEVQTGNIQF